MFRIAFLWLGSVWLLGCSQNKVHSIEIPFYNTPDFTPVFISNKADVQRKINHKIADFSFLNQDSTWVSARDIQGKIHVASFVFTSCGSICPTLTRNMKLVNDSLRNDSNVIFLSFSVTPWIDKPYVLNRYRLVNKINANNWHFLTGDKSEIYRLARQSYFAEEDIGFSKDSTEFLHTEHFILVDKTKRIRGVYNGTLVVDMYQLISDIKSIEAEE